jgi:hypothetical protein
MKWNKGKNPARAWNPRWVRIFPKTYEHYLKCGGVPVTGVENIPVPTPILPKTPVLPADAGAPIQAGTPLIVEKGKPYTHTLHSSCLTFGIMDKLARLICRCEGHGTQPLRVQTESGDVLWESDPPILVSAVEFQDLAKEYGV